MLDFSLEWEASDKERWLGFDLWIENDVYWVLWKNLRIFVGLFTLYHSHLVIMSMILGSYGDISKLKWTIDIEIRLISLKFQ